MHSVLCNILTVHRDISILVSQTSKMAIVGGAGWDLYDSRKLCRSPYCMYSRIISGALSSSAELIPKKMQRERESLWYFLLQCKVDTGQALTKQTDNVGMAELLHKFGLLHEFLHHIMIRTRQSFHRHRDPVSEASNTLQWNQDKSCNGRAQVSSMLHVIFAEISGPNYVYWVELTSHVRAKEYAPSYTFAFISSTFPNCPSPSSRR